MADRWTYQEREMFLGMFFRDDLRMSCKDVCYALNAGDQAKAELSEARNEIYRLRAELVEANSRLRSSYSIAERQGKDTNWEAFKSNLKELLEHQRLLINEWGGFVPETKVETKLEIERLQAENAELKASRDGLVKQLRTWASKWDKPINPISYDRTREVLEICDQHDPPPRPKVEWTEAYDSKGNTC